MKKKILKKKSLTLSAKKTPKKKSSKPKLKASPKRKPLRKVAKSSSKRKVVTKRKPSAKRKIVAKKPSIKRKVVAKKKLSPRVNQSTTQRKGSFKPAFKPETLKIQPMYDKNLSVKALFRAIHDHVVKEHQGVRQLEHPHHHQFGQHITSKKHGMQMQRVPRTIHRSRGR